MDFKNVDWANALVNLGTITLAIVVAAKLNNAVSGKK